MKLYESRAWLFHRYVVKKLTQAEIAKEAGTTQATINRWLKKHEIRRIG